jgi:rubrerythrin
MTKWWHCPKCGEVTDEFESSKTKICPSCRKQKNE